MHLEPLQQEFVLHFGEMGSKWGINRTVGQIYALLFLSPEPLNADQIVEHLGFSRSNVSMGLKELQAWNLVHQQHLPDDRRDYFSTPEDLWEIVRTLVRERKKREIDPMLSKLRSTLITADAQEDDPAYARIRELTELMELLTGWYDEIDRLPTDRIVRLLALGATVQKVLGLPDRVAGSIRGRKADRDAAAVDDAQESD
ncbi:MAG TPA: GbsR/MarR family transcriptional regulator [Pseudomonadales bacterium]|nr:GbsR/MarR family transcriptional regulator [Pseudomonadales bacterium]